jgi:hypothetical protein
MRRTKVLTLAVVLAAAAGLCLTAGGALADNGKAPATLSFFSGGEGAQAHWLATSDQPPNDTDNQAIELQTTFDATASKGYAGILVHHVTGIPAADFPDSAFWNKTPCPYTGAPSTLGSPRLVVEFQDATGNYVGYGDLRENTRDCDWEQVSDSEFGANSTFGAYPNSAWDVMPQGAYSGSCPFLYNVEWSTVQSCFAGDTTLSVFLVADAYGIDHLIDDITVGEKTFSSASDNGKGNNDPAGPSATTDLSLLPPLLFPPL